MSEHLYVKRPVVVEARRYAKRDDELDLSLWSDGKVRYDKQVQGLLVDTLEGTVLVASLGDWIIRGVKGEFYPCKPDIFAMTYVMQEPNHIKLNRMLDVAMAQTAEPHDTCLDHREYITSILRAIGAV